METGTTRQDRGQAHLAHHFATHRQQYESGKTGMWLFLSTEILLFSGLFCAYAVYRANHPEIFVYADRYLDRTLGGINTLVLILSSLTAAWAVRAAQLNQRRLLIGLLCVTLLCGFVFLGIKGIEYEHKWKHGLLWGKRFQPHGEPGLPGGAGETGHAPVAAPSSGAAGPGATAASPGPGALAPIPAPGAAGSTDIHSNIAPAAEGPHGLAHPGSSGAAAAAEEQRPRNLQVFFGIYFLMTGLHGVHVIAGMSAFAWVLRRAIRGDFSSEYFTPVDLTALYWHLVDIIWIYLFPLLYLIH